MAQHFEILHDTLIDGWVNTWFDVGGEPARFKDRESAESELAEFFAELVEEVEAGNIQPYGEEEFRIIAVNIV